MLTTMQNLSLNLTWFLLICNVIHAQDRPDFHFISETVTAKTIGNSEAYSLTFCGRMAEALNEEFFIKLRKDLVAEPLSNDSIMVTLKLPATDTLNQIMVSPTRDTTNHHQFGRLYDGIKFYRYEDHKFFIMFDMSQYVSSNNYCDEERDGDKRLSLVLRIEQSEK